MEEILQKGQLLVAPVVLISACGLLALALYQRLSSLADRSATFYREEFELIARVLSLGPQAQNGPLARRIRLRRESIEEQRQRLLGRANLMRASLVCLLATVMCMLVSSIVLAVSVLNEDSAEAVLVWALAVFLAGVVVMLAAMALGIIELARSLNQGVLERAQAEPLDDVLDGVGE